MTAPVDRLVGRLISDRYRVLALVGTGGMGEVYRAEHVVLHRTTALKLMRPALGDDPDALARFRREAEQASRISHPNVAAIYDFGETGDGLVFLAMEFVEGESLADRLARTGRLTAPEAARVIGEAATGLAAAHRRGVLHRDLKPANIMLARGAELGEVKLVDFGIARSLLGAYDQQTQHGSTPQLETLTKAGTVLGTPAYASPEQLAGEPLDMRSDLYALALVAFEALTGQHAFQATSSREIIVQRLTGKPRRLLDVLAPAEAPWADAVQAVLDRALDPDPTHRHEDATAFATAFADALGFPLGTPTPLTSAPRATATAAPVSRARLVAIGVAAVAVLAVGFLLVRRRAASGGVDDGLQRIAVLPFENQGPPEDDYFVDGLTDDVRSRLAAVPGLRVTARASTSQYRRSHKSPQEIGRELGVAYLLTGTVRWSKGGAGGDRVRVTPELVRVSDAITQWTKPMDEVMSDVFSVQSDIARTVAVELDVALAPATQKQLAERPTQSLDAYDAFLKGEQLTESFAVSSPSVLVKAIPYYEQAVKLDSTFAKGWAGLSMALTQVTFNTPSPEGIARAQDAAERAIRLAPQSPDGYRALGQFLVTIKLDYAGGLQQYLLGLKRVPNDAQLLAAAGSAETTLGRWEDGLAHMQQAERIDPRSTATLNRVAQTLEAMRRYPEALNEYDKVIALSPTNPRFVQGKVITWLAMGRLDSARALLARTLAASSDTTTLIAHFALYQEMMWVLDPRLWPKLVQLSPADFGGDRGHWGLKIGGTYKLMGDTARARMFGDSAVLVFGERVKSYPEMAQFRELHARALALAGRKQEAIAEAEQSLKMRETSLDAKTGPYVRWQVARVLIQAGAYDRALDLLEPLLTVRGSDLTPAYLNLDPGFAPLRELPRFQRLAPR